MSVDGDPWVLSCLEQIGYSHLSPVFVENEIDFDTFKGLSREELATILVGKLGPQKKIYAAIESIRAVDAGESEAGGGESAVDAVKEETPKPPKESPETFSHRVQNEKPHVPSNKSSPSSTPAKSLPPRPTGPAPANSAAASDPKGFMAKYGFAMPTAGAMASAIIVGTIQKVAITSAANLILKSGSGANMANQNNSVADDFQAKYGNLKTGERPTALQDLEMVNEADPSLENSYMEDDTAYDHADNSED